MFARSTLKKTLFLGFVFSYHAGHWASTAKAHSFTATDFQSWYQTYLTVEEGGDEPASSGVVAQHVNDVHYVFVAGFLNEFMPNYFVDNREVLLEQGVPDRLITILYPPSNQSTETNAAFLKASLEKLQREGPEPFVIIAHSKGGTEALALCLEESRWMLPLVRAVFLMQPAVHGSRIADYLQGQGADVDWIMPLAPRLAFLAITRAEGLLNSGIEVGLTSMTQGATEALWDKLTANGDFSDWNDKLYYIHATQAPTDLRKLLRPFGWYLDTYYDENDGILTLSDQKLDSVGTDLIQIEGDHLDLVVQGSAFRDNLSGRRAMTEAIVHAVSELGEP